MKNKPTAASEERSSFDPSDPFDAMAEMIRRDVIDVAIRAQHTALYRDLDPQQQVECFTAGAMTAIVGYCFASVKPEGRDAIIEYLSKAWPQARQMAEDIMKGAAS